MLVLTEIDRERYGRDHRAMEGHSERTYSDNQGRMWRLARSLDHIPPEFEIIGPYAQDFEGLLPLFKVKGERYWGSGFSWPMAQRRFLWEIGATLQTPPAGEKPFVVWCRHCGARDVSLSEFRDFRGNCIAVCCAACCGFLKVYLDTVGRAHGWIPGKCSPYHTPTIRDTAHLRDLAYSIMAGTYKSTAEV